MKKIIVITVAWILVPLLIPAFAAAQFYEGFEAGSLNAWEIRRNVTLNTEQPFSGRFVAEILKGELRDTVHVSPGTGYTVECRIHILEEAGDDWGGFRIAVNNYSDWVTLGRSAFIRSASHGGGWMSVAVPFTSLSDQIHLTISQFSGSGLTMRVLVDEIRIRETNVNTPPWIISADLSRDNIRFLPSVQHFSLTAEDDDGAIASVRWEFGDNAVSSQASGSRTVTQAGNFTAVATVTDDDGATATVEIPWLATAFPENLLENGDFETGDFSGWQALNSVAVTQDPVYEGRFAVRLENGELTAAVPTAPGARYKLTGAIRIMFQDGSDWGGFRVQVEDSGSAVLGRQFPIKTTSHGQEWKKLAISFTAATEMTRVRIGKFSGPDLQMQVLADDFRVFEDLYNADPVISGATLTPSAVTSFPAVQAFHVDAVDANGAIQSVHWDFGDGTRSQNASGARSLSAAGSFIARVHVADDNGAVTVREIPWQAVDPDGPSLSFDGPGSGSVVSAPVLTISGHCSEAGVLLSTDRDVSLESAVGNGRWQADLVLKPGWNRILVQTRNPAGKTAAVEQSVRYEPVEPLSVGNPTLMTDMPRQWEPLVLTFDYTGSAATHPHMPYDATPPGAAAFIDGLSARAVFTDPEGQILVRPAFLHQAYEARRIGTREWMNPLGMPVWTVRFSPPASGDWTVRIETEEAKGQAMSNTLGFTVGVPEPGNRGPIAVSRTDSRYFEYGDGSTWLGMGHGLGFGTGFHFGISDLLAGVGQGNQNFFRLWISGQIWGSAWQPWAAKTLGYDGTVPATGLSLESAYGNGLASWRMDNANPILFQGFMTGHAGLVRGDRYRLRVRWRTQDMAGPENPDYPFGVCMKFVGWPEPGATYDLPVLIPHVGQDTPWHIAESEFTATSDFIPNLAVLFENATRGTAYVDEIAVFKINPDGTAGPQILRSPRANAHLTFDQRQGAGMDAVLSELERYHASVRLVISEKQEFLVGSLGANGLPDPLRRSFFGAAGTASQWFHQAYWRHLIARFGHSRAVHSWELVNETSPGYGRDFALAAALAVAAKNDGNPHPASLSTWATLAASAWQHENSAPMDHVDFHAYVRGTGWLGPKDALANDSAAFFKAYDDAAFGAGFLKPVIWGEVGIDGDGGTDGQDPALDLDPDGIWLHKMNWSRCNSGGVYPIYWYTRNIFDHDLHWRYGSWFRFMAGIPLSNGLYTDIQADVAHPSLRALGQKDMTNGRAHIWIDNTEDTWRHAVDGIQAAPATGDVTLEFGTPGGTVNAVWYDTATGLEQGRETVRVDDAGRTTLYIEDLQTDIAVKLDTGG